MRSVFVHLEDASEREVQTLLDNLYPGQRHPWIAALNGDPCLYIEILDPTKYAGWSEIAEVFGGRSFSVSVGADVSGRHPGDWEVREFVTILLRRFKGGAQDDYTDNFWSLDEILAGELKEGHPFFDYAGWHQEE